jgi:hypothetical protein
MKHTISLAVAMIVTTVSFGQIENINVSSDSSVVVDKLYAGMLSSTAYSVESLQTTPAVSIRFGAMATYKVSKHVSIRSFGMIESDLNQTWGIEQFYIHCTPTKHWVFAAGQMATISTEQRPHPVSGKGQFETWTLARIPGGAPGIKAKYVGKVSIGAGVAARNGYGEYHGSLEKGSHNLSGYYRESDRHTGFAYTYSGKKLYTVVVYTRPLIASTIVLGMKKDVSLFIDVGYSTQLLRGEGGVFKRFSSKWVKGLISTSYNAKTKCVMGYLFVHL